MLGACAEVGRDPPRSRALDLGARLTPEQKAVNEVLHAAIAPDECDVETEFDPIARRLADDGSPEALAALRDLAHAGGRPQQAASGRAWVLLAQRAAARGRHDAAADFARDVYLSGVPHRVRIEALRVFARSGPLDEVQRFIRLIRTGQQDGWMAPMLSELESAVDARVAKRPPPR